MPDGQIQTPPAFDYRAVHAGVEQLLAKEMFFIGAYPKSGTTWMRTMLDHHPEISCSGEGHFCNHFAKLLMTALKTHNAYIEDKNKRTFGEFAPFPLFVEDHFAYLLVSAMALVLSQSKRVPEARVIGEKTPDNLIYFPMLAQLFPQARFLHVVRDPRDCAVSAWFHNERVHPEQRDEHFPTFEGFTTHIAGEWRKLVERGLHFNAAYPERCLIVHYENLARQPEKTLGTVLEFLGADAAPAVVQHCVAAGSFQSMSGGRQPGTEDRTSFLRQGRPGNWTQHFTEQMNNDFLDIVRPAMTRVGYRS